MRKPTEQQIMNLISALPVREAARAVLTMFDDKPEPKWVAEYWALDKDIGTIERFIREKLRELATELIDLSKNKIGQSPEPMDAITKGAEFHAAYVRAKSLKILEEWGIL